MAASRFDRLAEFYDSLVDWPKRLAREAPFYQVLFSQHGVRRVLDVACGTGHHAAMFNRWGCAVEGVDSSAEMIGRARALHGESATLHWAVRDFREPLGEEGVFDAVICVDNSLALAADRPAVESALQHMTAALRPGGVCVIQVLNIWRLPDGPIVWQKLKRIDIGGKQHVILKGVHRAGSCGFVEVVTYEDVGGEPKMEASTTRLVSLEREDITAALKRAGCDRLDTFGDYERAPFDRQSSLDLIVVARQVGMPS